MRAVARAHQTRDLAAFEQTLRDYREELSSDPTIRSHLAALYDTLLEQNLLRIVEPYSVVEIEYVAQQVGQGRQDVEAKCVSLFTELAQAELLVSRDRLSQMILDKVFHGVLDQGRGCLLVFDEAETDVCASRCESLRFFLTPMSTVRTRMVPRSRHWKKLARLWIRCMQRCAFVSNHRVRPFLTRVVGQSVKIA
jgi:hypothetical protein